MRMRVVGWAILVAAFSPCVCLAGVIGVGPFTGEHTEGWESGFFDPVFTPLVEDILDGTADARALGANLHSTGGWIFFDASVIYPHSGNWFAGNTGPGSWEIEFHSPISMFGAYFGTNTVDSVTNAPDGSATFFDAAGDPLGTSAIVLGDGGTWTWNGWRPDAGSIKRVQMSNGSLDGGFLMLDDLQTTVPEPSTLLLLGVGLISLAGHGRRRQGSREPPAHS
jgi:hypothetical protein